MSGLRVLDLAGNDLRGDIPDAFVNMASLEELDLTSNVFVQGQLPTTLGQLYNMRRLDLAGNNISGKVPRSFGNLCNLHRFNLLGNSISGEITDFVDGLSRCVKNSQLEYLALSGNKFGGTLPITIGALVKLEYLDLSSNSIWGTIPASIGSLSSLRILDVTQNKMNGTIPQSIGKLSMLTVLYLAWNSWEGTLTEAHFQNLSSLQKLDLAMSFPSSKHLAIDFRNDWLPPFSNLNYLRLDYIQIGPSFPSWIQSQIEIDYLSLADVGFVDTIPVWFWTACAKITYLDLSTNKLRGQIPHIIVFPGAFYINLGHNNLDGPLPIFPTTSSALFLENNFFSGPLPQNIDQLTPHLSYLDLSSNSIEGRLPPTISKIKTLTVLALKNNKLSGQLPQNWTDLPSLRVFDVTNNSLSGQVPASLGFLSSLRLLSLGNNNLVGKLPPSLGNCSKLISLNLGGNKFNESLPSWIGERLSSLMMLSLRSNLFHGNIPREFCLLSNLQVVDIAHNRLSGAIPQCLGNLSKEVTFVNDTYYAYQHMMVASKGRELFYDETLHLVHSLDLSANNLSGEIPGNITSLPGLGILNLSMNHLTGRIPGKIGDLRMLETFDVSSNKLSGPIPQSLSSLTFLSHLNLSFNNLTGKIPSGNQLQTLADPSIYEGNFFLCGPPLDNKFCAGEEHEGKPNGGNEEDNNGGKETEVPVFYISMALGFIFGFWAVCGTLVMKASWRYAYFRFFDDLKDKVVVFLMVNVAHFISN